MYLRKSTDEGDKQIRSLDDQYAELNEIVKRDKLTVVKVFREKRTAKMPGRQIFNQMLDQIVAGEANAILAWHPDRLARNAVDGGRIIHLIDSRSIETLTFVSHWFEPTPQGKFTLSLAFGQSKYYVDNLSEVIRRSHRQKVANGIWPLQAPFGYVHEGRSKGIIPDPVRAPLIRRMFERYELGDATLAELRRIVTQWGLLNKRGRMLQVSHIHWMLSYAAYHGVIVFKGELHPGIHPPIVSIDLFNRVQTVLGRRGQQRRCSQVRIHPLRGMFRCGECGCMITMETQKGRIYLRCSKSRVRCSQPYLREDQARDQIKAVIREMSMPADYADAILAELDAEADRLGHDAKSRIRELERQLEQLREKRQRLTNAYLDGQFSNEEHIVLKNPMVLEERRIRQTISDLTDSPADCLEPARMFIRACKQADFLSRSSNLTLQCRFLRKVASNRFLRDRTITVSPLGAWKTVALYGPNGAGGCEVARVSGENPGDFLKGAASAWLLDHVLEKTPVMSVSVSDTVEFEGSTTPSMRLEGFGAVPALA